MGLYYIAFRTNLVIAYGYTGNEISFPTPNDKVETFEDVKDFQNALSALGYTYNEGNE